MKEIDTSAAQKTAEDSSSKLCLEVIENNWAKKTGGSATDFETAVKQQLHAENASHEQVAKMYDQALEKREIERHGEAEGKLVLEKAKEHWKCK
jgi:hypothetical protein